MIVMLTGPGVGKAQALWQKSSLLADETALAYCLQVGPVEDTEIQEALRLEPDACSKLLNALLRRKLITTVRGVPANSISPEQRKAALKSMPRERRKVKGKKK